MNVQTVLKTALVFWLLCAMGCAAVVVGGAAAVGTYTYVSGQLKSSYNANMDRTFEAALAGCNALGLPILDQEKKLSSASVKTKDGDKDVWIILKAKSSAVTEVSIRVGLLGDEFASKRIHEALQANLNRL
ncbi:MAG: DUF3568 family protein [Desulfovibrionales bacterium]|nr:DUF3568 family protein [Desulfovibrionales bacterium]